MPGKSEVHTFLGLKGHAWAEGKREKLAQNLPLAPYIPEGTEDNCAHGPGHMEGALPLTFRSAEMLHTLTTGPRILFYSMP